MGIRLILLGLLQIISIIATDATNISKWVIEGERIELSASTDNDRLSSAIIKAVNWFSGRLRKAEVSKIIVSLADPSQGRFSIDFTEQTFGDMIIKPVNRVDAGDYTCQVVKDVAEFSMSFSHLDVYYMNPPSIILETGRNNNVSFFCTWSIVYPDNSPVVGWFRNGQKINTASTKYNLKKRYRTTTLEILNVSKHDTGNYTCNITVDTNRGPMSKTSKESAELRIEQSDVPKTHNNRVILRVTVSVVVVTVCVISFLVFCLDRKYSSSKNIKSPFELFVEEEFFCNEGESADIVLRYEPKNAKTASISWYKIDKDQDRTDHILTFNTDFKQSQKAPTRKRLPSLRPMNMNIGVDTNIYSGMSFKSKPVNYKPGPSYYVLDEKHYDIKKKVCYDLLRKINLVG